MGRSVRACLTVAPLVCVCACFEVEGLAIESRLDAIVVGDTVSLSVVPRYDTPPPGSVLWTTSDSAIATVDELGVVTGTGPGSVQIQAEAGKYVLRIVLQVWATAGPFVALGGGVDHTCALADDGGAWCWGSNLYGQLGTFVPPDRCFFTRQDFVPCSAGALPAAVGVHFTDLAVGHYHTCGLSAGGTAYCWGWNDQGQLGLSQLGIRPKPTPVDGDAVFESLTAGGRTTCGITADGDLLCWGGGLFPVDGPPGELTTPTQVAAEHRFALAATSGRHTCGVTPSGATWCWGFHDHGQLGVESVDSTCGSAPCTRHPREVASAPTFTALALGDDFSCGLAADGAAWCWGGNARGQLGDGTRADRWEPMPVAGGHAFTRLAAGRSHACGVDGDGLLYCWGSDPAGFGNGGETAEVDLPVPAAGGLTFTVIGIGYATQCGVDPSGVTLCWGQNVFGTLGSGRTQRSGIDTTPERVIRHP